MLFSRNVSFSAPIVGSLLASGLAMASMEANQNVSALDLNQNIGKYTGKQVMLSGQVDRVLGNGAYIISDSSDLKDPNHRVLVFTAMASANDAHSKQKAGIAAPMCKDGDKVHLNGKVEQFIVSNEVDRFSPKSDMETVNASESAMPVVVIQPGALTKN